MANKYDTVIKMFETVERGRFYGSLSFQYRNGILQTVKKEEIMVGKHIIPKSKPYNGKTVEENNHE